MKKILPIIIFSFITFGLFAQQKNKIPISVGYFGPYFIQPGVKVGTEFSIKEWTTEKSESFTQNEKLLFSPELGVFVWPKNHTGYLANAELGYKKNKIKPHKYSAVSIGLGYLAYSQKVSGSIDLGSGDFSFDETEMRSYILPTINYECGRDPDKKMGWFVKFSVGRKISTKVDNSAFFGAEVGLKLNLKKNKDETE